MVMCSIKRFILSFKTQMASILHEGESSKRVQTFVVFVLSFRSSSSSSCSVRRWRLLSKHEATKSVAPIQWKEHRTDNANFLHLNKLVVCSCILTLQQTTDSASHLSWSEDARASSSEGKSGSFVQLAGWNGQTTQFASEDTQICWSGLFAASTRRWHGH